MINNNLLAKINRKILYSIAKVIPDELYIKWMFYLRTGVPLDLGNPQTFNEKLQWLKLNYHKQEFTMMVDKYAVKQYISDKIGREYVIPLLGVWDRPEDIDFNDLPNQFVLKCNHTSGLGIIICKDKDSLDIKATIKELKKGMAYDTYYKNREWPYRDVKKRIFAEEYKVDESGTELKDYKLYCFDGEPKLCQVDYGKGQGRTRSIFNRNLYDMNWNLLDMKYNHPNNPSFIVEKPTQFEKMKELARTLAKDEPFMRTDFYNVGNQIYFSEITFYPVAGFGWFKPKSWDLRLGEWLKLPTIDKKQ